MVPFLYAGTDLRSAALHFTVASQERPAAIPVLCDRSDVLANCFINKAAHVVVVEAHNQIPNIVHRFDGEIEGYLFLGPPVGERLRWR